MQEVSGSIPLGSTSFRFAETPGRKRGNGIQNSPRWAVEVFCGRLVGEVSPTGFFRVSRLIADV